MPTARRPHLLPSQQTPNGPEYGINRCGQALLGACVGSSPYGKMHDKGSSTKVLALQALQRGRAVNGQYAGS
eukprot:jgi/Botrbrau1/5239/Bobra.0172s0101.1